MMLSIALVVTRLFVTSQIFFFFLATQIRAFEHFAPIHHRSFVPRNNVVTSLSATATTNETDVAAAASCPFTSSSTSEINTQDRLTFTSSSEIPSAPMLPFFGTLAPPPLRKYMTGLPQRKPGMVWDFWPKMHRQYGDFYRMGIPLLGQGIYGTLYVVSDAQEMRKVLRAEGKHPRGLVELLWPSVDFFERKKADNKSVINLFRRGPEWKRLRSFVEKDLLATTTNGYLPSIMEAAAQASQNVEPAKSNNKNYFNRYLNACSLEMFCRVLFGESIQDRIGGSDKYKEFVKQTVVSLADSWALAEDMQESLLHRIGIYTPRAKACHENTEIVYSTTTRLIREFRDRRDRGELTEREANSYLARALERQSQQQGDIITQQEAMDLCYFLTVAATDTTAALISWNLFQLALHPTIQQELYQELKDAIQNEGNGKLTPEILLDSTPLLHAIIRETHRVTPTSVIEMVKTIDTDVEIHGVTFPKGTTFWLDHYGKLTDPNICKDPLEYQPKRWLPQAVAARKGTAREIMDSPMYATPFSQGARKCPGSRVATLEVYAFVAQFVLDWKMTTVEKGLRYRDIPCQSSSTLVPTWPDIELTARSE